MKIDFEFDTKHGKYRDSLTLPDDHTFTDAEIQAMKEQRRDNWIDFIDNPPPAPPAPEPEPIPEHPDTVEIAEETYTRLDGVPPSGAKLIEVYGVWYYKV
jgi:hypothetical protein